MRDKLLWIHRWLGLTAGIIFGLAAATGAVLVYQPQLDVLFGGPRFGATDGELSPAAIEAAVRTEHPEAAITGVLWRAVDENVVRVTIDENGRTSNVWVDNGSGRLLEPRPQLRVLLGIRRLHVDMFMGRIGWHLVTWASAAALIALALGIYLWWPGLRKFWSGFRIRLSRGTYILNFDLHQVLGILSLPLLAFGAATGVLMTYAGAVDRIERVAFGPRPETGWGDLHSTVPADSADNDRRPAPGLATLMTTLRDAAPHAEPVSITVPKAADGVIRAELEASDGATVRVGLDRYTGEPLATRREPAGFRFDRHTNEQLHQAKIGGPVLKVLYMLSCIMGFVLLPTGVVVWWLKRTRKADSAERRATTATGSPTTG